MDTTPPQAPPALVSDVQQQALDSLHRLIATHTWLGAAQEQLPALPVRPAGTDRNAWFSLLDAFWQQPVEPTPGAAPVARLDLLAARLAEVMRDDAVVRHSDGTLPDDATRLALRFSRSSGGALPADIEVRHLLIGETAYAGAVVLIHRSQPMLVMRFMPGRGWDTFAGLDSLHAQTEETLRQMLATHAALPGIADDDMQQKVAALRFVGSRPVEDGDVFVAMATRIATLQAQKVMDAWPSAVPDATQTADFIDEAGAGLNLQGLLDIPGLLAGRQARLIMSLTNQRLAGVPAAVARDWRAAFSGLQLAEWQAAWSARQHAADAPLSLGAWTREQLVAGLRHRGVTADPDDIQIEASGDEGFAFPASADASATTTRMSLASFALRNTGRLDSRSLRVVMAPHAFGEPAPALATLRTVVRELDLAPRFGAYLRRHLHESAAGSFRKVAMQLQQARMRAEAADARVGSFRLEEGRAFLDDHEERGFRLVEAVLDSPVAATRARVGGHRVAVHQLMYQGAAVSDVLVIGVDDPRSTSRVVLYTPGAPDGKAFREYSDRAAAAREVLYTPAFENYLLQRLPMEYGEPRPTGSQRQFRVSDAARRAHWALAAPGDGRATLTEEPFTERRVDGDVRRALFDTEMIRQARDVAWVGRSTNQADADTVTAFLASLLRGLRGPGAMVEDTAAAAGQALRATWRFYDNVKAGDHGQAFVDFTEAYTASLALAGWNTGVSRLGRTHIALRSRGGALALRDTALELPLAGRRLDPRYAARSVNLADAQPDARGIHRLGGRRYIRQQEHVFEVRHDPAVGSWRLARPHALDAAFPGPAIEPLPAGGWRLRTDIGLRGGWVDDAAFPQPLTRAASQHDLAGLTDFQRWMFEQSFRTRLRNPGEASLIFWEVTARPEPRFLTLRQRTAWGDALRFARAAPREPLTTATPGPGATWRVLPPAEWPTSLWHYPEGYHGFIGHDGSRAVPMQVTPGSGLRGLPATMDTPIARVGGTPTGNIPGARAQAWIQIHLERFRGRSGPTGQPAIRVIEDTRGGERVFVIQPGLGFPQTFFALEAGDFTAGRQPLP